MIPYDQLRVIDTPIPAERQSAKRHYGVHPYFTRRPYNVVRQYIQHYSREGDRVLDPFGGSGVTAIEAFLSNRIGIQNDINPLANFIAKGVADLSKGTLTDYTIALRNVCDRCEQRVLGLDETDDTAISGLLEQLPLPANVRLPANSDVQHYHDLFSPRQLAALAVIREAIDDIPNRYARSAIRLAWSAALTKINRTFLSAKDVPNRGAVQASSVSIAIKLPRSRSNCPRGPPSTNGPKMYSLRRKRSTAKSTIGSGPADFLASLRSTTTTSMPCEIISSQSITSSPIRPTADTFHISISQYFGMPGTERYPHLRIDSAN